MPKQYSYQNHPVVYKVSISGQDVTSDIQSIQGIETSLDYPNINEFRVNEATLVLQDPDNDYNPYKTGPLPEDKNFYERNGGMETPAITQSGYRSPVVIEAGFLVDGVAEADRMQTIYAGQILNIYKDAKTKDVRIICSDESQKIRDEPVTDFGVQKKMRVESSGGSLHGNYPFFSGLTQPSEDSVSGTEGTNTLDRKRVLRTEGPLDSNNFRETAFGIETEGKPTEDDPILTFKAPWRSRTIESLIQKLLAKYQITNHDIQLPIESVGEHFSNLGKAEYETAFNSDIVRPSGVNPGIWQWSGTVTDMMQGEMDHIIYLLVSQHGSPLRNEPLAVARQPKIIKWNLQSDERTVVVNLAGSSSNVEAWKFAANSDFSTFYVLACDPVYVGAGQPGSSGLVTRPGFEFGSYNPSEYNNAADVKTKILRVPSANMPNPTSEIYIQQSNLGGSALFPQVAMHYHLGFTSSTSTSPNRFSNRQGSLPDSRRNFVFDPEGNILYYPYANKTVFGVAKMNTAASVSSTNPSSIIQADRDRDGFNSAGFDFWIGADDLYFAFTEIDTRATQRNSRFRIVRSTK